MTPWFVKMGHPRQTLRKVQIISDVLRDAYREHTRFAFAQPGFRSIIICSNDDERLDEIRDQLAKLVPEVAEIELIDPEEWHVPRQIEGDWIMRTLTDSFSYPFRDLKGRYQY